MNIRNFWIVSSVSFIILLGLSLAPLVQAWTGDIVVTSSEATLSPINVKFGVVPDATNGNDEGLDVTTELPPAVPGAPFLNVAFVGPDDILFNTDIRPAGPWTLNAESNRDFTLSWDVSSVPSNLTPTMDVGDGIPIDMREVTSKSLSAGTYGNITITAQIQPWTADITAKSSDGRLPDEKSVSFGISPDATSGIDADLDVITEFPPPPFGQPYLDVAFAGPGLAAFSKDIRQAGPWKLMVNSNAGFTLQWDLSSLPSYVALILDPGDGTPVVNMRTTSTKVFSDGGNYRMTIKSAAKITKVEPATGGLGTEVAVDGIDFAPDEDVTIDFGASEAVATAKADASGAFSASFTIDAPQLNGPVTIKATGASGLEATDSTFVYSGPAIGPVAVKGGPVKLGGTVVVTLTGEADCVAKFSIEGVEAATDVEMTESPAGTYVGEFSPEKGIQVEDAIVTVTLTDAAGNSVVDTTQTVTINTQMSTFEVTLSKGINMISVPLADETLKGDDGKFHLSGLYDALGGSDSLSLIIYYDAAEGKFKSYTSPTQKGTPIDIEIKGDTGLIINMKEAKSVTLRGDAWPGTVDLKGGINLIGLPVDALSTVDETGAPVAGKLSDLDNQLGGNATQIFFYDAEKEKFSAYTKKAAEAAPELDIDITGDLGLIVIAKEDQTLTLTGVPWSNPPAEGAPPATVASPLDPTATPVLVVDGTLIHEVTGDALNGLSVTARNLATGVSLTDTTGSSGNGRFSIAFVDINDYAAKVGDVIELSVVAQSGSFKVEPIRYTLTATDIALSRVALDGLIASVIPSRSELLRNFPNPFNPETWIPFKLAKTADVVITIYDVYGHLVRTIDLGNLPAGLYSTKAKAAHWDGTNAFGERVASGVYFYHLQAGKFSATQRMVILK